MTTQTFPRNREVTQSEAAACEAVYQQRWQEWLAAHPNAGPEAFETHRAIWQGAYGAETITTIPDKTADPAAG